MKKVLFIMPSVALFLLFICTALPPVQALAQENHIRILASTFPVYLFTKNIVADVKTAKLEIMLPPNLGCPHDYALTPQDMYKLARADVFVVNGLGLEEFLGSPLKKANPHLFILDSAKDITQLLYYTPEEEESSQGQQSVNPHIFASPRMAAQQVAHIAEGLAQIDPASAAQYRANAKAYVAILAALDAEFIEAGKVLKNNRIITQHGIFDYLARDMGLEIASVIAAHPGQEPSAASILSLIGLIKEKKVGAIFTEPQYKNASAKTLAREAQIPLAALDPVANGPDDAPLSYYQDTMRNNLNLLTPPHGNH